MNDEQREWLAWGLMVTLSFVLGVWAYETFVKALVRDYLTSLAR